MIHTARGRFILTVYEVRTQADDLPYFLSLLDHLADKGCPVPATIHDRKGARLRELRGKPAALIEFLPGFSPTRPDPAQAFAAGAALAQIHEAGADFPKSREPDWPRERILTVLETSAAQSVQPADLAPRARELADRWPGGLPQGTIHSDLFPDNVLMDGERVTGMIDFYFAHFGTLAYDLAVLHASWSFEADGRAFRDQIGRSLIAGYETIRSLEPKERDAMPVLAQFACLRFVASRVEEWSLLPTHQRKDPADFLRRWDFYEGQGHALFA